MRHRGEHVLAPAGIGGAIYEISRADGRGGDDDDRSDSEASLRARREALADDCGAVSVTAPDDLAVPHRFAGPPAF